MIEARFYKKDGWFTGYEISGHAGYAEHGKDIVCAAVSGCVYGITNAIIKKALNMPEVEQGLPNDSGYLSLSFGAIKEKIVDDLIHALLISLETIEKAHGEHIKVVIVGR